MLERVLKVLAPFFLSAFLLCEETDESAESAFFLPASKTIVTMRLFASGFVAETALVYRTLALHGRGVGSNLPI
jgi:hypothetical protein